MSPSVGLDKVYESCSPLPNEFLLIQLSDFGLAIADGIQNKNNIKLSGTLGCVAPEYLLDGM